MKRTMFATVVAVIVLATPLFGAQASAPAKPAPGAAAQGAAAAPKADEKKQPATAAKAVPAPPKVTSVSAVKSGPQKPASAPAKAAPAAPKAMPAVVKAGPVALSPVQEKLQTNKDLVTDVQGKLAGKDVIAAASGFKDLPEFVSTVYAAHNLGLPFEALKAKLQNGKRTGLRQAIQELRPEASAAIEAQRAQYDAVGTIRTTERAATEAAAAKSVKPTPAVLPANRPPSATPAKAVPAVAPAKATPSATPAKSTPSATPAKVTPSAPAKATPSATPAKATPSATPAKATPSASPAKAAPKPVGSTGRQ